MTGPLCCKYDTILATILLKQYLDPFYVMRAGIDQIYRCQCPKITIILFM